VKPSNCSKSRQGDQRIAELARPKYDDGVPMHLSNLLSSRPMKMLHLMRAAALRLLYGVRRRAHRVATIIRLRRLWMKYGPGVGVKYSFGELPIFDDDDEQGVQYHQYAEAWFAAETARLAGVVGEGTCVLDIGANQGFMTLCLSKLTGPRGKIIAFEPSATVFRKLCDTVRRNNLPNVQTVCAACGESKGSLRLSKIENSSGLATLLPPQRESESEEVRVLSIDDFVREQQVLVHFMKIDTEGYEPQVLRGAIQTIRAQRPVIYIELSSRYRDASLATISILKALEYDIEPAPALDQLNAAENYIARPAARAAT
jgi:FkbM family methyltransferase